MSKLLKGAPVTEAINKAISQAVEGLAQKGITPTLCIFRVGERPEDIAYENSALKRCEKVGVAVKVEALPKDVSQEDFDRVLQSLNEDEQIHGILMFRPLPGHLDEEKARKMLRPEKDVDGITDGSLAGVFTGNGRGFPPCTAQAAMEILKHYDIELKGKRAVVLGRSLVIGRPVAMMLMEKDATVTICHSKTQKAAEIAAEADILIAAMGRLHSVGKEYTNPSQIIIDVGINPDPETGGISGDVDFQQVSDFVEAITPVPGGVGTVTTGVLISHVVEAAEKMYGEMNINGES